MKAFGTSPKKKYDGNIGRGSISQFFYRYPCVLSFPRSIYIMARWVKNPFGLILVCLLRLPVILGTLGAEHDLAEITPSTKVAEPPADVEARAGGCNHSSQPDRDPLSLARTRPEPVCLLLSDDEPMDDVELVTNAFDERPDRVSRSGKLAAISSAHDQAQIDETKLHKGSKKPRRSYHDSGLREQAIELSSGGEDHSIIALDSDSNINYPGGTDVWEKGAGDSSTQKEIHAIKRQGDIVPGKMPSTSKTREAQTLDPARANLHTSAVKLPIRTHDQKKRKFTQAGKEEALHELEELISEPAPKRSTKLLIKPRNSSSSDTQIETIKDSPPPEETNTKESGEIIKATGRELKKVKASAGGFDETKALVSHKPPKSGGSLVIKLRTSKSITPQVKSVSAEPPLKKTKPKGNDETIKEKGREGDKVEGIFKLPDETKSQVFLKGPSGGSSIAAKSRLAGSHAVKVKSIKANLPVGKREPQRSGETPIAQATKMSESEAQSAKSVTNEVAPQVCLQPVSDGGSTVTKNRPSGNIPLKKDSSTKYFRVGKRKPQEAGEKIETKCIEEEKLKEPAQVPEMMELQVLDKPAGDVGSSKIAIPVANAHFEVPPILDYREPKLYAWIGAMYFMTRDTISLDEIESVAAFMAQLREIQDRYLVADKVGAAQTHVKESPPVNNQVIDLTSNPPLTNVQCLTDLCSLRWRHVFVNGRIEYLLHAIWGLNSHFLGSLGIQDTRQILYQSGWLLNWLLEKLTHRTRGLPIITVTKAELEGSGRKQLGRLAKHILSFIDVISDSTYWSVAFKVKSRAKKRLSHDNIYVIQLAVRLMASYYWKENPEKLDLLFPDPSDFLVTLATCADKHYLGEYQEFQIQRRNAFKDIEIVPWKNALLEEKKLETRRIMAEINFGTVTKIWSRGKIKELVTQITDPRVQSPFF